MKRSIRICLSVLVVLAIIYLSLPYYARQALIHLMPVIDDLETFERDTVHHDPACIRHWPHAKSYNQYRLPSEDAAYLDSLHTISFLVIHRDSILFESYRDGWNDTLTSNLYSATKTIVGLLTGIALDEGKIHSLDDPVSRYIPAYNKGRQADVTLRHLLTMSGGMAWDEAYASLFSITTHGYYGNDLYELVTGLDVVDEPGVQFSYRSGETQLLAFVLEDAPGQTLSQYAEEKLYNSTRRRPLRPSLAPSGKLGRAPTGLPCLYGRDDAPRLLPERPMGARLPLLLRSTDVDISLPGRSHPLHAGHVGAIHICHPLARSHCSAPGTQTARRVRRAFYRGHEAISGHRHEGTGRTIAQP